MMNVVVMAAWMSTWLIIALRLRKPPQPRPPSWLLNSLWLLALIIQGANLILTWTNSQSGFVDFFAALSVVLWLTCFLLFLAQLNRPLESLGLLIIPFIPPTLLGSYFFPTQSTSLNLDNGLGLHIFISLLAYSLLTLAALHALLLGLQIRQLHDHKPNILVRTLPPLQDMESLLFKVIALGWLLLSLSLISGFIYLDDLFAQHVAHKTLLSILAWCVFAILLYGHWQYGWRGKKAIRWTLVGFLLLMIAFFGSKFVLEYLKQP
ncbi:cytochrome C assembly family protein [Thiothrix eikelboomii]|uniref:cytochrome C assembly family protein n=1 Tax=Thiothrix eikelboomii TaxID=92487 RepID=UPI003BB0621E